MHPSTKLPMACHMQGKVTEQTLRQLFDEALSTTFPHLLLPGVRPCLSVAMHSEGRYAFVELASPEMATAALQLSGQLNFLGSQMTVGRPSGYIDPQKAAAAAAAASKALQEFTSDMGEVLAVGEAPPLSSQPTQCLCIDHMVGVSVFTDEEEYQVRLNDDEFPICPRIPLACAAGLQLLLVLACLMPATMVRKHSLT
jgi:hypothetical protein